MAAGSHGPDSHTHHLRFRRISRCDCESFLPHNLTFVQRNIRVLGQSLVAANTLLGCFLPRLDRAAGAVLFERRAARYSAASGR